MKVAKHSDDAKWLLLTFSLPTKKASQRVEVWRKLQRYGGVPLGNSGYLLPNNAMNLERFEWLAQAIRKYAGESSVVRVQSIDNLSTPQLVGRFAEARARDYKELIRELHKVSSVAPYKRSSSRMSRLRVRFREIVEIDFFNSPLQKRVDELLARADTPPAANDRTSKVHPKDYVGRLWVTRPRPGIDRSASAWLIRKYIDKKARFAFTQEGDVPAAAIPFDMFQGGFGHRGAYCTFETLQKEFRIRDRKVSAIGEMVHDADLADGSFGRKEAFGVDEVLKGWARKGIPDRELLERGMEMIEGLYHSVERWAANEKARPKDFSATRKERIRSMKVITKSMLLFVSAFGVLSAFSVRVSAQDIPADYQDVLKSLNRKGDFKAGVLKVNIPRNDLKMTVEGISTPTPFGFGGWIALTKGENGSDVMMGDLVLLQEEVNPVLSALLDNGIDVTALHNHFFWDDPHVYYMHVHGMGKAAELATRVKPGLDLIGHVKPEAAAPASASGTALDTAKLAKIAGHEGEQTGAVYKITVGRDDLGMKEHGAVINARMGLNTWAAFTGTQEDAAVAGDVAMLESEVTQVLKALRKNGLDVVAIHHHMTGDRPVVIFLHYWGRGPAEKLATGFKAALDELGKGGGSAAHSMGQ